MSKRQLTTAAITIGLVFASLGNSQAQGPYTPASLNGTYGFAASGTLRGFNAAVVGINSFDGRGGCGISARLTAAVLAPTGVTLIATSCSYTVNPAGFGVMSIVIPGFAPFSSTFVITGDELRFMLSDADGTTIATGVSKKVQ